MRQFILVDNIEKEMIELEEIWKDIQGYEGQYMVSNLGRVKSFKKNSNGNILKISDDGNGYKQISLYKNGKSKTWKIHRLVAIAFIPNPNDLPQVNHKDEDPSNNCVDNLEWCDGKYNSNYGNHNKKLSEAHTGKVLTEEHKQHIGKASKERWQNEEYRQKVIDARTGFKHSEETKKKMSESAKKKVRCIETGEIFNSMQEAGDKYNRCPYNLSRAIKNGKTFAGYHWELLLRE